MIQIKLLDNLSEEDLNRKLMDLQNNKVIIQDVKKTGEGYLLVCDIPGDCEDETFVCNRQVKINWKDD